MEAIEPGRLVRAALTGGTLDLPTPPLFVVAAGKAAWPMARAFVREHRAAGGACEAGVVAGPRQGSEPLPAELDWFDGGHPSPNAASEAAGRRALALADRAAGGGTLMVLLSGGASAMLAVPAGGLSLADKIATSRALMHAGVAIADLNCVRKHLSAIKGGQLGARAHRAITWAVSDVHGPIADDPAVIGSGPTVADPSTFADALAIVRAAGVAPIVPAAVMRHLEAAAEETPKAGDPRLRETAYAVIGNQTIAVNAAARLARTLGYDVHVIDDATSGEARDAGAAFASNAIGAAAGGDGESIAPRCVIGSGETTVRVRGAGRGGRNQEFVLAAVPLLETAPPAVLGSAGTDGIDGPTDAAGAIADTSSAARARRMGLRWDEALAANGAYDFFEPLGDLIVWGPTGTNVGDVHVMLVDRRIA